MNVYNGMFVNWRTKPNGIKRMSEYTQGVSGAMFGCLEWTTLPRNADGIIVMRIRRGFFIGQEAAYRRGGRMFQRTKNKALFENRTKARITNKPFDTVLLRDIPNEPIKWLALYTAYGCTSQLLYGFEC